MVSHKTTDSLGGNVNWKYSSSLAENTDVNSYIMNKLNRTRFGNVRMCVCACICIR